ncbi:MAG: hypothetical protein OXN25_24735, partial [Candidatus Poribacteria bacterium]|nr:hypothetical protein [Candidatus Poribacteria bacterium]
MKNLMTQKFIFGLLMACVLASGVQGVADALTFGTTRSGDLQTASLNQQFTIKFSVTPKGNTSIRNANGDLIDQNDVLINSSGYYINADGDYLDGPNGSVVTNSADRVKAEDAVRYHYNQEQVDIAVTNANIIKVGSYGITPAATHSLMETGEREDKLSSSITLTLVRTETTGEEVTITISDMTPLPDLPNGTDDRATPNQVFTVYVVQERDASPTGLSLGGLVSDQNYQTDHNDFADPTITVSGVAAHTRVKYEVIEGSGRLYVQEGTRMGSASRSLSTSSSAVVHLDMAGTTNRVRASIAGAVPTTGIYIFGYPTVAIVSGNNQEGALGGRLENPLVVRVTDGKGRNISGLAAVFSSPGGGVFFPVSGTTVYTSDIAGTMLATGFTANTVVATSTRPGSGGAIAVQTNSSGQVSTYFQLAATGASQVVNVTAGGSPLLNPFRPSGETESGIPSIEIESGSGQRAVNGNVEDPLVVVVRKGGQRVSGETVTFTTDRGVLSNTPRTGETSGSGPNVTDITDGQGRASVTYSLDFTGPVRVVASISGTDPVTYRREVTFGINGAGSSNNQQQQQQQQQQQEQQQSTTPTLTLSSTTISGAAGSSQSVTATVQRGTTAAPGIAVTFQVGSLTPVVLSTNTSGQASHTFTLPSADTTLSVSANVLGTPVSASATLDVTGTTDTTDTTDDTTPVQVPTDI